MNQTGERLENGKIMIKDFKYIFLRICPLEVSTHKDGQSLDLSLVCIVCFVQCEDIVVSYGLDSNLGILGPLDLSYGGDALSKKPLELYLGDNLIIKFSFRRNSYLPLAR